MIEKRKFPRKPVDLVAAILVEGRPDPIEGRVRDLSIGGGFLLVNAVLPFGQKIFVRIDFPAPAGSMKLPAIVRWSDPDGIGVQFGLLGARETHAIAVAITHR